MENSTPWKLVPHEN